MTKRPDNLETVRLALELMKRIPRNRSVTARDLRDELSAIGIERSMRTIQRQLDSLCNNFDIERDDRNTPFGYRWKELAQWFAVPGLTEKESLLLSVAEQNLKNLLPAQVMRSLEGFFEQARRNLAPGGNAELERQWLGKVRFVSTSQPLLPPTIRKGVLEEVSNALYANRWLQVDYTNADGKRSVSRVMPLGMAQQGPSLYLVCRYEGFDNERHQALHRMHSAKAMPETFIRPKDFDLERYDGDGHFGFGEGKRINVTFDIDKGAGAHLQETKLSTDQTVTPRAGKLRITATVVDSEWFWIWVRGFGDAIKIVKVDGNTKRGARLLPTTADSERALRSS